jgi:hypothetical protein
MKTKRAKKVERAIRLVWDSMDSHLAYTYKKHHDKSSFHKKCVREYAELIKILADLF